MTNPTRSERSIFTSKADVLEYLQTKLNKSKIEKLIHFTVQEWKANPRSIVNEIQQYFSKSKFLIVRSSALGEDSLESSYAGVYESILDVLPDSEQSIKDAINSVAKSYVAKNNHNQKNQILIQNQTVNIMTSGVVFTRTPDVGSPYYVINFEDGGSTTGTTHGLSNNMLKIYRNTKQKLEKKWDLLLDAIKEIESILDTDLLDIEFGITKSHEIIVFQVRPLTSVKQELPKNLDKKISQLIKMNQNLFSKLNKTKRHVSGKYTLFSDMSDWNPSEIIGDNPNYLDYSLYDYLIMNDAWHRGRSQIEYHDVNPYKLMIKFGNKPYVDIRGSFNSLISKELDKKLKEKLLNYFLNKLSKNPHLHDKVEFEILFTCYDLTVENRLQELLHNGFTKNEIAKIKSIVLKHTNLILTKYEKTLQQCNLSLDKLDSSRAKILSNLTKSADYKAKLNTAQLLLSDCKKLGTIPFSNMARIAFIATAILNSLVKTKHLNSDSVYSIMQTISTPLSEFQNDLIAYHDKKLSYSDFIKKYGHLRPGTYDITAMRYDKTNSYFNMDFKKPRRHKNVTLTIDYKEIFKKHGLDTSVDFLFFLKEAIAKREFVKFSFTKNLSEAMELIANACNEIGFTRDDIANLDLKSIMSDYKTVSKAQLQQTWKNKISKNKQKKIIYSFLVLPPLITSSSDFEIIKYYSAKPNFITEKSISSEIIVLDDSKAKSDLKNKIILLENADPGYDWIFTRNPSGLITKYGGVASHMSIRCAELNLPAAIGCGEIIYEQLLLSSKVLLDCKNKQIIILEHEKDDQYVEERRVLKSLGYIR
ncbi:MAG: hypothetical protein EB154_05885 [Nitrosopumilaceae archaeon]|nr:hypothetical protein [Nitrosopumilaceae archaeon]